MSATAIDLAGKRALVTGTAMGIGQGIARVLAGAGAHVIAVDIAAEAGQRGVDELRAAGHSAEFHALDLRDDAALVALVARLRADAPSLDVLVNNAGLAIFKGVADTEPGDWDDLMSVDLRAPFMLTRACLPLLEAAGSAAVIHIASVHASMTVANMAAYAAAKGALVAMTRSMAQDLGGRGIRVNALSPGFVDTPLFRGWLESEPDPEASMARVLGTIPTGAITSAEEIGGVIAFLASDMARSITGANVLVDGGLTTRLMH